jgi:hypothetical protein
MSINIVDGSHDAVLEYLFGSDADVAQNRAGELGEETLDQVQPRAMFGVMVNWKRPFGWSVSYAFVSLEMCAE